MARITKSYGSIIILLILMALVMPGCKGGGKDSKTEPAEKSKGTQEKSKPESTEKVTGTQEESKSVHTPLPGGEFNKFFPEKSGDFTIVYTQEKKGMAQAKLKKAGADVAALTISDVAANPGAADKFKNSSMNIAGFPAAKSGGKGTAILVENRFQVQVRSHADDFTDKDREEWLKKFDLSGLAQLKNK